MVDLWPSDLGKVNIRTPVSILREQAAKLGEKTKNVVEAQVQETEKPLWANFGDFSYIFYLVAPLLKGYRYKLFAMSYPIQMYPVKIALDADIALEILSQQVGVKTTSLPFETLLHANSEEEYTRLLGFIFNSSKARNTINAILAHAE